MARACDICGKTYQKGYRISHSHIKTRKIWRSNLQRVKTFVNGATRHIHACTRCIRSGVIRKKAS